MEKEVPRVHSLTADKETDNWDPNNLQYKSSKLDSFITVTFIVCIIFNVHIM